MISKAPEDSGTESEFNFTRNYPTEGNLDDGNGTKIWKSPTDVPVHKGASGRDL